MSTRHAGVLLPLFSAVSGSSWGIGEFADLPHLSAWLRRGGFDRLMVLPLGTMRAGETSPYSASSAMALDPIFIAVERIEDFERAGGAAALSDDARSRIAEIKKAPVVAYADARRVKTEAIDLAFDRFVAEEWHPRWTPRASMLAEYIDRERWWLDDYALFEAIGRRVDHLPWHRWPEDIANRRPHALDDVRREFARDVLREQYVQWIAETQWQQARQAARLDGIMVFGDVPFMVDTNSADVWARPHEFLSDATVGAPPDAYSATGQDWGLPVYRWDEIARGGFAWIRDRARRMTALYDGFRIDHVIGFYRTYARPLAGDPYFSPSDQAAQIAQGETIVRVFRERGAQVIAEDLGVIPDFAAESLRQLGLPGYKVLRWERAWSTPGQPFIDPASYSPASIATTGTHDTAPMATWWDEMDVDERTAICGLLSAPPPPFDGQPLPPFDSEVRDRLLEKVYAAGSNDLFLPMQDIFGWHDRINTPGTVTERNWTWRLPWPVDWFDRSEECVQRARFCHELAVRHGRR